MSYSAYVTDRFLEYIRCFIPFMRPRLEIARRFFGRIDWNGMEIGKEEVVHSIAFKSDRWIDLVGFEMLCGDNSFRITYTITKGQGVLGKLVVKGSSYIPVGDILHPSKLVRLSSIRRLEPEVWYSVNIIINIHEYDMALVTSGGSDGRPVIETDTGVTITYNSGLESCAKTNLDSGQIAGVVFNRIDSQEEEFLDSFSPRSTERKVNVLAREEASSEVQTGVFQQAISISQRPVPARGSLPPLAGIITPPIRTEEVLRQVPPYKY